MKTGLHDKLKSGEKYSNDPHEIIHTAKIYIPASRKPLLSSPFHFHRLTACAYYNWQAPCSLIPDSRIKCTRKKNKSSSSVMFLSDVKSLVSPANVNINVKTTEAWYGVSGWILIFQSFYCIPKSEPFNLCAQARFINYLWDHIFMTRRRVQSSA